MAHTTGSDTRDERPEMRDGEDFVCDTCGCEIMLKHHGDPARMPSMTAFTWCCGTPMRPEHAGA